LLLVSSAALTSAALAGAATPCDQTTLLCSSALAKQKLESNDRLPVGIDTGWMPQCDPATANGHCSDHKIQVRALVAIDPLVEGVPPLYVIDMTKGANIQVEWPTTDNFVVSVVRGTNKEGSFRINHTLTPEFGIYVDTPFYTGELNVNANTLINLLPGAQFNYFATGTTSFDPWAFETVWAYAKGTDLSQSKLFAVTFEQLGKLVGTGNFNDYVTGSFSFNATTDTTFEYKTTNIKLIGGQPITGENATGMFPMQDADYLEFSLQTEGTLRYVGNIELLPVINITSIMGFSISMSFPISVGLDFPYDGGEMPVTFPATLVHLPLPNVFVPSSFVDFGQVATGGMGEKVVSIDNTGELGALLSFTSSDPQFAAAAASTQMGPADSYDLKIRFKPTKSGPQEATITVTSNDPDHPTQTFKVMGFGEGEDLPDPGAGGSSSGAGGGGSNAEANDDGGCGCATPGSSAPVHAFGMLSLLALIGLGRRRARSRVS
jgi:MYXO-CTERM domain-containing protein